MTRISSRIGLALLLLASPAFAHSPVEWENDYVANGPAISPLAASKPDPESQPLPGESQDDVDRRLGPWLDLKNGGIAVGDCQGKVVTNPDGSTSGAYGSLLNGSLLPDLGHGFKRVGRPESNWAAGHMLSLLTASAAEISRVYPGTVVHIGGIAKPAGGFFVPHKSHQNGLDADVLFLGRTTWDSVLDKEGNVSEKFERQKNWDYWRSLVSQRYAQNGKVDSVVSMILVDPAIKTHLCAWAKETGALEDPLNFEVMRRVRPTEGHDDHFHIRLQCSPYHPECKKGFSPPKASGCEG